MARARAYAAERAAEIAATPPRPDPRLPAEILAAIEAELARTASPRPAPGPLSATELLEQIARELGAQAVEATISKTETISEMETVRSGSAAPATHAYPASVAANPAPAESTVPAAHRRARFGDLSFVQIADRLTREAR